MSPQSNAAAASLPPTAKKHHVTMSTYWRSSAAVINCTHHYRVLPINSIDRCVHWMRVDECYLCGELHIECVCWLSSKQSLCSSRRTKNLMVSWIRSGQSGCRRCAVRVVSVVAALSSTRATCPRLVQVSLTRDFSSTLFLRQKYTRLLFIAI